MRVGFVEIVLLSAGEKKKSSCGMRKAAHLALRARCVVVAWNSITGAGHVGRIISVAEDFWEVKEMGPGCPDGGCEDPGCGEDPD